MPPLTVPIIQVNVLGAVAVKLMFGAVPLQIVVALAEVTDGVGFTVTVIVKDDPAHDPVVDVGVTI